MPSAWIDATGGVAGDMLLAALLDAGADEHAVRASVAALGVEPITIDVSEVRRHGLRARRVDVRAPRSEVRRTLADVLDRIEAAGLPRPVTAFAGAVFAKLADAEARVHGRPVAQIHFHEVGALDSLADVVGCATALHGLGLLAPGAAVTVSPVALGSGRVATEHGPLPVPAPAVVELLRGAGAPVVAGPGGGELSTPTGVALLVELAGAWGPCPPLRLRAAGLGAGGADFPTHANVTRVLVGDATPDAGAPVATDLVLVESTIDDLEPRLLPGLLDALHRAGALDAWATSALMRKGRAGYVVSALTREEYRTPVFEAFVRHSPTLGVRSHPVRRSALRRDEVVVTVDGRDISVKRGWLGGEIVTAQPEFDDVARAASALGLPEGDVLARATALARDA